MLYTKKGDKGITKTLKCEISKNSAVAEALGTIDELNSFLGICKVKAGNDVIVVKKNKIPVSDIFLNIQQTLFIIQAELAGSDKTVKKERIKEMEVIIDEIEKQMPEIKSFLISGGELGSLFDTARAISRRAERRVVSVKVGENTLKYLNRLSSLLYALARHSNYKAGVKEDMPDYK